MITLMQVIQELRPGAQCRIIGDTYNGIMWDDKKQRIPTEDEVNEKLTELQTGLVYKLLREERNKRLAECDWVVTKNAEYGYNISKEWRRYRQALRDLPSISYRPELDEYGRLNMDSVAWPTPPE